MKKTGILFVAFIMASTFAMAQPGGNYNPEERAKRQTEELTEKLDLTKDQAKQVEAINIKYGKKRSDMYSAMRAGGGMDREAMGEKREAMQKEQTKEMKAVLSDAQMIKYEAYLKEQAEKRAQGRGQGGGNRR